MLAHNAKPQHYVQHTAGGALANVDDPEERPPPPRQVNNTPSQPWRVLRRATEWKSRWLHLRILCVAWPFPALACRAAGVC